MISSCSVAFRSFPDARVDPERGAQSVEGPGRNQPPGEDRHHDAEHGVKRLQEEGPLNNGTMSGLDGAPIADSSRTVCEMEL